MYQNDKNENKRSSEAKIIEFEIYHDNDYEHEIHLDEFV